MVVVAAGLLASGCTAQEPHDQSGSRLDDAALRQLGLTRVIPDQVIQACAQARRLTTVNVLCPELIPDTQITTSTGCGGQW